MNDYFFEIRSDEEIMKYLESIRYAKEYFHNGLIVTTDGIKAIKSDDLKIEAIKKYIQANYSHMAKPVDKRIISEVAAELIASLESDEKKILYYNNMEDDLTQFGAEEILRSIKNEKIKLELLSRDKGLLRNYSNVRTELVVSLNNDEDKLKFLNDFERPEDERYRFEVVLSLKSVGKKVELLDTFGPYFGSILKENIKEQKKLGLEQKEKSWILIDDKKPQPVMNNVQNPTSRLDLSNMPYEELMELKALVEGELKKRENSIKMTDGSTHTK